MTELIKDNGVEENSLANNNEGVALCPGSASSSLCWRREEGGGMLVRKWVYKDRSCL